MKWKPNKLESLISRITDARQEHLSKISEAENIIQAKIKQLGLIKLTEAAKIRNTSRQAIIDLINRERIDEVRIFDHPYVFRDQVKNLKTQR
jgi:hypothetical protein